MDALGQCESGCHGHSSSFLRRTWDFFFDSEPKAMDLSLKKGLEKSNFSPLA